MQHDANDAVFTGLQTNHSMPKGSRHAGHFASREVKLWTFLPQRLDMLH